MHTIFLIMAAMSLVAVVPSALRGGGLSWAPEQKVTVREQVA
jgi:hypothetical protein